MEFDVDHSNATARQPTPVEEEVQASKSDVMNFDKHCHSIAVFNRQFF
jgi:hypothetical protein